MAKDSDDTNKTSLMHNNVYIDIDVDINTDIHVHIDTNINVEIDIVKNGKTSTFLQSINISD